MKAVLQPLSFNGALFAHFHAGIQRPTTNPSGAQVLSAEIRVDKEGQFGTGGTVTLRMGEKIIGKGRFEKQVPFRCTVNETFDVGCDTVSSFPDLYESPFPFTGKLKRILVDISNAEPQGLAAAAKLAMAMQ